MIRKLQLSLFFCICLLLFFTAFVSAEDILVVADPWCPYNCAPESDAPGYIVEIAKHAFESKGHRIVYQTIPWARAIDGTRNGTYDAIIGLGRDEAPDMIFPEQEIGIASHSFYVTEQSDWTFTGLASLQGVTLGVIKDYSYGTLYDDYIQANTDNAERVFTIAGNDSLQRTVRMLASGRIDVLVEDQNVLDYHLLAHGEKNQFIQAGIYAKEKIYMAFSPANKTSAEYALLFDEALQELKKSGKLSDILNKYGLQEWD